MRIRRGRPLGVKSFAVLQVVSLQPMPIASLASTLQLSYRDTVRTVHRLVSKGEVSYGERQGHTGGRPARVVQLPAPQPQSPAAALALASLCAQWRGGEGA
jgi:hypothetical protein